MDLTGRIGLHAFLASHFRRDAAAQDEALDEVIVEALSEEWTAEEIISAAGCDQHGDPTVTLERIHLAAQRSRSRV